MAIWTVLLKHTEGIKEALEGARDISPAVVTLLNLSLYE